MTDLAVLVPVLARPHRVRPLLDAIATTTPGCRVLFICDPDDRGEQDAIDAAGGERIDVDGGYAIKINRAVRATDEPYVLLAADDVRPHPGWFDKALDATRDGAQVVGLNDLIPRPTRPDHATHFLLTREAAELSCLDGSPGPLCERYFHWRVDDELIATAEKRGIYRYAPAAIVEHVDHPMTGGTDDPTYAKGRSRARFDNRTFRRREHLWT